MAPSGVVRMGEKDLKLAEQCEELQRELTKSQGKCERLQRQLQAAHLRIGFLTKAANSDGAEDELVELRRESAHVLGLLRDKEKQEEDVDCELSKLRAEVARLVGLGTGKENSVLKRKSDSALTPETKRRKVQLPMRP